VYYEDLASLTVAAHRKTQLKSRKTNVTLPARSSFKGLLTLAHDLADQSGAVIRPQFRRQLAVDNKAGRNAFDPVTKADQAAERAILKTLKARVPDHGVVGEEYGATRPDAPYQWVIDPIDGTRSFITGVPMWGTLIGLLHDGAPVLGMMNQPFTGERFWAAEKAAYAWEAAGKARRIRTRSCARVADALMMTTSPDMFEAGFETEAFERVKKSVRMTRFGGDCYAYCLLASGFVDLVIECSLKTYDIVALIPIVERAGGRITTWDGEPATSGGRIVASGDPALHDRVLKLLNR
jgi:histidinol phosphatase-like enzyme (inositol monophosphatase family)